MLFVIINIKTQLDSLHAQLCSTFENFAKTLKTKQLKDIIHKTEQKIPNRKTKMDHYSEYL